MHNGFAPIRRGLLQHIEDGRMTLQEAGAYTLIHMRARSDTGIWWGSARALSFACNGTTSERAARRILEELARGGYIKRFAKPGSHGNYAILINRYECTSGARKGQRLNALQTEEWEKPVYYGGAQGCEEEGEENGKERSQKSGDRSRKLGKPKTPKAAAPPLLGAAKEYAFKAWEERFKAKPSWGVKDYAQLARLLRRHKDLTLEDFCARWDRYLSDDDKFVAKQGYGLAFFCSGGRFDAYSKALAGGIPTLPSRY